ncbi:MAG: hypothetical protein ABIU09_05490 [Pyrinomonadaceae bacterium]
MKFSLLFAALFLFGGPINSAVQGVQTKPAYDSYKGITIGMAAADVRTKLGKPADQSDTEDDFSFSDSESARVFYNPDKTVRVISIMYTGDLKSAPAAKAIVGADIAPKPDGGQHRTVQYPKAGFWISYVRTGGDDPMVIVTLQRMAKEN